MKKAILFAGLIFLLLLSGCAQPNIEPQAKLLPEIKAIYDQYPNATMKTLFLQREAVVVAIDDIRGECRQSNLPIAAYWLVTVRTTAFTKEFYVNEAVTKVVCTKDEKKIVQPAKNDCNVVADCDDSNSVTKDECKGTPKKCFHTAITACKAGDSFCPPGCKYGTDRDCPAIDECQSDTDCLDSNHFTADSCTTATPKICKHQLKTCEQLNGYLCDTTSFACKGTGMPSSDKGACCDVPCVKTGSCTGVKCPDYQKCVNGSCYDKTCEERELPLCVSAEICTKEFFKDPVGITCCTGECRKACTSDSNCLAGEACTSGYCIVESCSSIGGKTCNATTEFCAGEIEKTLNNANCCTKCQLKKCSERSGIVCDAGIGEKCTKTAVKTFDTNSCCLAECAQNWCFDKPCAINQKCDEKEQQCVLKTCDEMGGEIWETPGTCKGLFYAVSGAAGCCLEKTCLEMGGAECGVGTACQAETRLALDTGQCCVGTCLTGV